MKLPIMLFSACLVASLFDVGPALSQTPRPSPAESASHRQAMDKCQELYGGWRGAMGRDRYAYIERCFKDLTGKYPSQVNMNCTLVSRVGERRVGVGC
jgi:hypothetical protein